MKYIEFLWATDWLSRYHPKFYASELMLLADDILKWFDEELPEDSATLVYLKSLYQSPDEAMEDIGEEIQLLTGALRSN